MIIRTVSYKRTKQVRPYEPEVLELTIDLEQGDTVDNVVAAARIIVAKQFGESDKIDLSSLCSCKNLLTVGCQCGK